MTEVIPAILPASWDDLTGHIERVRGAARRVQVDVVDGRFAPDKTWPYRGGEEFARAVESGRGLPRWEELDYEFDLMVEDPAAVVLQYVQAGASRVVIHATSASALPALRQLADLQENGGEFSAEAGVALGAHQSPDDLLPFAAQCDFVQVMGIEREGRQGEPFDRRALHLLERLRHRYPHMPLQVDGGVKLENARELSAAGATGLVAGSALFSAADFKAAYGALYNEANAH
jgi:ribulose-phosphate 3-epimerase